MRENATTRRNGAGKPGETASPGSGLRLAVVIGVVAALAFAAWKLDVQELIRQALDWVAGLGVWGPVAFGLIYILAAVLLIPGSLLTLGAGVVFGVVQGSAVVAVSATLGATAAFLVGRYAARDWVASKIAGNRKFAAIDEAVGAEGWKIVGLTRLSPVFPFTLLNYAFGITRVRLRDYVLASMIGMIPGTVMYVYLGSLAGDLAALGSGQRSRTTGEMILYIVGLVATVTVTVYVTRVARAALEKKLRAVEINDE